MGYRRIRQWLWLTSGILATGAFSCLVIAFRAPVKIEASDERPHFPSPRILRGVTASNDSKLLQASDFANLLTKPLQRPLVDPPPPEVTKEVAPLAKPVVVPKPQFDGMLVGTLIDSDDRSSRAWLKFRNQTRLVVFGEKLLDLPGKPEIHSISDRGVMVHIGEHKHDLRLKSDSADRIDLLVRDE